MNIETKTNHTLNHVTAPSIEPSMAVLGVDVLNLNWNDAFKYTLQQLSDTKVPQFFAFLNAHNANIATTDPEYREILERTHILPDGIGVDLAGMMQDGQMFEANLNGTDFVPALFIYAQKPLKVAMIGGRTHVAELAASRLRETTPWHHFTVISDGYFKDEQTDEILQALKDLSPDILLVGMGTPLQEKWAHQHIKIEHAKLVFSVGALFDFLSDTMPRAPLIWRRLRAEWLFRLCCEPKRLWRRYILGNPLFLGRVVLHKFKAQRQRDKA